MVLQSKKNPHFKFFDKINIKWENVLDVEDKFHCGENYIWSLSSYKNLTIPKILYNSYLSNFWIFKIVSNKLFNPYNNDIYNLDDR